MNIKYKRIVRDAQNHFGLLEEWMQRMIEKISYRGLGIDLTPGEINSLDNIAEHLAVKKPKTKAKFWPLQAD